MKATILGGFWSIGSFSEGPERSRDAEETAITQLDPRISMGRLARSVVRTKLVFMCNDLIWCYQLQPPQSGLSLFACRVELFSRRTCRVSATRTDMRSFFQELLWVHTLVFGQSVSPTHVLPYPRRRARRGRALNDLTYPESSAPDAVLLARSV